MFFQHIALQLTNITHNQMKYTKRVLSFSSLRFFAYLYSHHSHDDRRVRQKEGDREVISSWPVIYYNSSID